MIVENVLWFLVIFGEIQEILNIQMKNLKKI